MYVFHYCAIASWDGDGRWWDVGWWCLKLWRQVLKNWVCWVLCNNITVCSCQWCVTDTMRTVRGRDCPGALRAVGFCHREVQTDYCWPNATTAKCKLCCKELSITGGQTSRLKRHSETQHTINAKVKSSNERQPKMASFARGSHPVSATRVTSSQSTCCPFPLLIRQHSSTSLPSSNPLIEAYIWCVPTHRVLMRSGWVKLPSSMGVRC